jgi:hypothetical protein
MKMTKHPGIVRLYYVFIQIMHMQTDYTMHTLIYK